MSPAPLTLAELAAAFDAIGGFERHPFVAVAVSGGPDSLALTILADRWAREHGGRLVALTVDHRLRPESAEEARTVARWMAARGIAHKVLVRSDPKPATGIQEAAREARYRLLSEWCHARGCLHLLAAHHREDQAETYLIRKRAGSGIDGLAGMSAVRDIAGLRLVRPLLGVPKARLVALLDAEHQAFLSDPSNRNPVFERARLRLDAEAADIARVTAELRDYGRQRIARETELDRSLAAAVTLHPTGFAVIDPSAIGDVEAGLADRLLGRAALCIGGAAYPLRRERVSRMRVALSEQPERARTLGGCRFVPWRGRMLVLRELSKAAAPVRLVPGSDLLWDRRFAVSTPPRAGANLMLGYVGQSGTRPMIGRADDPLPPLIHPTLPAVWDDIGLVAVPHLGHFRTGATDLPRVAFHPMNPLSRAGFTVV